MDACKQYELITGGVSKSNSYFHLYSIAVGLLTIKSQQKAYSYLTDHSNRGSDRVKPKASMAMKQRLCAHDIWQQENPVALADTMREHEVQHPNLTLNVALVTHSQ
jgi:hypothetical protein